MKLTFGDREEFDRIARMPANRKYRNIAMACIVAGILLMLVAIVGIDTFSLKTIMFLRGCAGVCAVLFIIFVAVYLYRVYSMIFKGKQH